MALADQIHEALEKALSKIAVKLTLDIAAELKKTTPVDTGWARANWVPEIGQRPPATNFEGNKPSAAEVSGQIATRSAKETALLSYDISRGDIFLSNNVPYIERLNAGSSTQQPAGFVNRAIIKALNNPSRFR
jgi:hypothetical protein